MDEDGEEVDPRTELVEKLLEYKMYKFMSYELREREEEAAGAMYRKEDIPAEVKAYREPVDLDRLLEGVTLSGLRAVFKEMIRRQEDRIDPIRSSFGRIEQEEVDLDETMDFVEQFILDRKACTFRSLLTLRKGKMYMVVTFLTILELMKMERSGCSRKIRSVKFILRRRILPSGLKAKQPPRLPPRKSRRRSRRKNSRRNRGKKHGIREKGSGH